MYNIQLFNSVHHQVWIVSLINHLPCKLQCNDKNETYSILLKIAYVVNTFSGHSQHSCYKFKSPIYILIINSNILS